MGRSVLHRGGRQRLDQRLGQAVRVLRLDPEDLVALVGAGALEAAGDGVGPRTADARLDHPGSRVGEFLSRPHDSGRLELRVGSRPRENPRSRATGPRQEAETEARMQPQDRPARLPLNENGFQY